MQKVTAREPSMRYRNTVDDVKTELLDLVRDKPRMNLIYCFGGIRYRDGTSCIEAFTRNLGTCRLDGKGKAQAENL